MESSFWDPAYGITGVQALNDGSFVYLFLGIGDITHWEEKLARVSPGDIEDVTAYTYWDADSQSWTSDFSMADAIFSQDNAQLPGEVSWNAFLGKWTIVYTGGAAAGVDPSPGGTMVLMRTADDLTGPWSEPSVLFDCRTLYPLGTRLGTYCYAATQHEELESGSGETIYVTVASENAYRIYLHEVRLAQPVHQFLVNGQRLYCREEDANCGAPLGTPDEGIAFAASASPGRSLSPIDEWISATGEIQYAAAASSPGPSFTDDGTKFYARLTQDFSVWAEPVYQWDAPGEAGGPPSHMYSRFAVPGYQRSGIAFYAPCLIDEDGNGINDCRDSMRDTGQANVDSDADGCSDAGEALLGLNSGDPWDFYSVPVPALIAAADPTEVYRDSAVAAADAQAIFKYYKAGARVGLDVYDQDLNLNGIADGFEYDRTVLGPAQTGPPGGAVSASDAQVAFAQFQLGYHC